MKWRSVWLSCLVLCVLVMSVPSLAGRFDPEILRIQESLRERGYDPGPANGVLGQKTKKALRVFQHDMQLPESGIVDAATRAALEKSEPAAAEHMSSPPVAIPEPAKASERQTPTPAMAVVPLVYKPPQRGTPGSRVAAAVRGAPKAKRLYALAPDDHIGLTTEAQPSLYWHLSELTDARIELAIVQEGATQPLFEGVVAPPARVGIQQIRLADYGVRLSVGTQYKWFVSIIPKPNSRSHDIVIGAGIQRIEPPKALRAQLAQARKENIPALYAGAGLWYDALTALTALIDATPGESSFRAQRATLLEQVGLQVVAAQER